MTSRWAAAPVVRGLGVDWGYHPAQDLHAAGAADVAQDANHLWRLLHDGA